MKFKRFKSTQLEYLFLLLFLLISFIIYSLDAATSKSNNNNQTLNKITNKRKKNSNHIHHNFKTNKMLCLNLILQALHRLLVWIACIDISLT